MILKQKQTINKILILIDELKLYKNKDKYYLFEKAINDRLKQSLKNYYNNLNLITNDLLIHSENKPLKYMKKLNKD